MAESKIEQSVVNNLTTNNPNVALSAAQGKQLHDRFDYNVSYYRGIGSNSDGVLIAINPNTNLLALVCDGKTKYYQLTPWGGVISAILSLAHWLTGGRHEQLHRKPIQTSNYNSKIWISNQEQFIKNSKWSSCWLASNILRKRNCNFLSKCLDASWNDRYPSVINYSNISIQPGRRLLFWFDVNNPRWNDKRIPQNNSEISMRYVLKSNHLTGRRVVVA